MAKFCQSCGKELGFFTKKHKMTDGAGVWWLCRECHGLETAGPHTRVSGHEGGREALSSLHDSALSAPEPAPKDALERFKGQRQGNCDLLLMDSTFADRGALRRVVQQLTGLTGEQCEKLLEPGSLLRHGISTAYGEAAMAAIASVGGRASLTESGERGDVLPIRLVQRRGVPDDALFECMVTLHEVSTSQIALIRLIRTMTDLGLKEAKGLAVRGAVFPIRVDDQTLKQYDAELKKLGCEVSFDLSKRPEGAPLVPFVITYHHGGGHAAQVVEALSRVLQTSEEALVHKLRGGARFRAFLTHTQKEQLEQLFKGYEAQITITEEAQAHPAPELVRRVLIRDVGPNKIAVIKAVRGISGLGLAESKAIVDGDGVVTLATPSDDARAMEQLFEQAGCTITLEFAPQEFEKITPVSSAADAEELYCVRITDKGPNLIAVIREVRAITGLSLKLTREIVEQGGMVVDGVAEAQAREVLAKITATGATAVME